MKPAAPGTRYAPSEEAEAEAAEDLAVAKKETRGAALRRRSARHLRDARASFPRVRARMSTAAKGSRVAERERRRVIAATGPRDERL
jgi:hypothetical protein